MRSYSTIHVGRCPIGLVAIKVYDQPAQKQLRMATREAMVLRYLQSKGVPNIPHLWSAYSVRSQIHLVQEWCAGGDLRAALAERQHGFPERVVAAQIAAPLLCTVDAMHRAGVAHRDIKLENVFLDGRGRPRLGDFDLAVFSHDAPARAPVGTVPYMAPEVLMLAAKHAPTDPGSPIAPSTPGATPSPPRAAALKGRLGPEVDIWSLGVCLFELVAGYKPFQGSSYQAVASAILTGAREPLPREVSRDFEDFVARCLSHDPAARPTARELLAHPWIAAAVASAGGGSTGGAPRSDSAGSIEELQRQSGGARARGLKGPGSAAAPAVLCGGGSKAPAAPCLLLQAHGGVRCGRGGQV
ncbi:Calcium-dependent protein kinase 13 [Monoraphidium neglectum]|uniref:Calcium-dependent protein kinase 13 n=1 Tax=Monoraphidium neglectum TaxID=145388 RepID=A0A0D2K0K0_9CHLO|nr:Calcium-dependent protein kinase 13 [Monoraphidium neglectum]KIZ04148.1 Calcium-dependent protein kinase 13 [Monoraphidium neglectum]|eukprot:XP_013903167.1 Calcium-dependent protein kinase 13 [Monoraphidium neglectum]